MEGPQPPDPGSTPKAELLDEARKLVTQERGQLYGDPLEDFKRTAALWTTHFQHLLRDGERFMPHHVADAMELLKMSRRSHAPEHRDSWVDSAGYAACGWECVVGEMSDINSTMRASRG